MFETGDAILTEHYTFFGPSEWGTSVNELGTRGFSQI